MGKKLFEGLPGDLSNVIEGISKETAIINITVEKRSYGKIVTLINGIPKENAEEILKNLKKKLGCGGTYKDGVIELQGDHREKLKKLLVEFGFKEDNIYIE